ncbi:MAG TPA: hypothetical protein VGA37_00375 [Gemmatimonadales bacterium]
MTTSENFRQTPSSRGRLLATVNPGAELASGNQEGGWTMVTLDGWVWAQSVRPETEQQFDLRVSVAGGENLRVEPNGSVRARLMTGLLLEEIERNDEWVRVQRTGWMWTESLEALAAPATATSPPADDAVVARLDRARLAATTGLFRQPGGDSLGAVGGEAQVRVLDRTDEWARVRLEAWVRVSDIEAVADGVLRGVTGAEVRSQPADFQGKLLQWTVQLISLQTADGLRRDLPANGRYALARGPLPERGFVYLILGPEHESALASIEPLTGITIIGRVRTGRSQYLGNPVLDLIDFSVAQR